MNPSRMRNAAVFAGLVLPVLGDAQRAPGVRCEMAPWTNPVTILGPTTTHRHHPWQLTASGDRLAILGEYGPGPDDETPWTTGKLLGVLYNRRTGATINLAKPDTTLRYEGLRGHLSANGRRLRLVWAEPIVEDLGPAIGRQTTKHVWGMDWIDGRWTPPARVAPLPRVGWWDMATSPLLADRNGTTHLIAPPEPLGMPQTLVYLRRAADSTADAAWQLREIPVLPAVIPIYTDLFVSGDELHVTFIASAPAPGTYDANSVWYVRSGDLGATWEKPVRIQLSGTEEARESRINRLSDGSLIVAWIQRFTTPGTRDAIRAARSRDGGASWEPVDEHTPSGSWLTSVKSFWTDPCGTSFFHTMSIDGSDGLGAAETFALRDGAWSQREMFRWPGQYFTGRTVVLQEEDGTLLRAWSTVVIADDERPMATWFLSYSRPVVPPTR